MSDEYRVSALSRRNPAVLVCRSDDQSSVVRVVAKGNWADFQEDVARRLDMPAAARTLSDSRTGMKVTRMNQLHDGQRLIASRYAEGRPPCSTPVREQPKENRFAIRVVRPDEGAEYTDCKTAVSVSIRRDWPLSSILDEVTARLNTVRAVRALKRSSGEMITDPKQIQSGEELQASHSAHRAAPLTPMVLSKLCPKRVAVQARCNGQWHTEGVRVVLGGSLNQLLQDCTHLLKMTSSAQLLFRASDGSRVEGLAGLEEGEQLMVSSGERFLEQGGLKSAQGSAPSSGLYTPHCTVCLVRNGTPEHAKSLDLWRTAQADAKRCTAAGRVPRGLERAAARRGGLKVATVMPERKLWLQQLLQQATELLKMGKAARRAFLLDGSELRPDSCLQSQDTVLCISCGEDYSPPREPVALLRVTGPRPSSAPRPRPPDKKPRGVTAQAAGRRLLAYAHPALHVSQPDCHRGERTLLARPGAGLEELLDEATRVLNLSKAALRAFTMEGLEITHPEQLQAPEQQLMVSCGEPWRPLEPDQESLAELFSQSMGFEQPQPLSRAQPQPLSRARSATALSLPPEDTPGLRERASSLQLRPSLRQSGGRAVASITPLKGFQRGHPEECSLAASLSCSRLDSPPELQAPQIEYELLLDSSAPSPAALPAPPPAACSEVPLEAGAVLEQFPAVRALFDQYANTAHKLHFVQFARFAKEFNLVPGLFGMGKLRRIFFGTEHQSSPQPYAAPESAAFRLSEGEWGVRLWGIAQAVQPQMGPTEATEHLLREVLGLKRHAEQPEPEPELLPAQVTELREKLQSQVSTGMQESIKAELVLTHLGGQAWRNTVGLVPEDERLRSRGAPRGPASDPLHRDQLRQASQSPKSSPKHSPVAPKPADKPVDKPADKPAPKPAPKPVDKPVDKPADKPVDKPADKPVVNGISTSVEQSPAQPATPEQPASPEAAVPGFARFVASGSLDVAGIASEALQQFNAPQQSPEPGGDEIAARRQELFEECFNLCELQRSRVGSSQESLLSGSPGSKEARAEAIKNRKKREISLRLKEKRLLKESGHSDTRAKIEDECQQLRSMLQQDGPAAERSWLSGAGSWRLAVDESSTMCLRVLDHNGCPVAGAPVVARMRSMLEDGSASPEWSTGSVQDCGDGNYELSLVARSDVEHEVHVTLGEQHVHGSPWLVPAMRMLHPEQLSVLNSWTGNTVQAWVQFWQLEGCELPPEGTPTATAGEGRLVHDPSELRGGVVVVEAGAEGYFTTLDWFYLDPGLPGGRTEVFLEPETHTPKGEHASWNEH